ncbi:MAG: type II toxin-antitoxin system VapC family toxin [Rickettsiaceae bacterium]|nr:type II toxin-antitoxin system VapC family toxin [Rickettsiaceae bacterium]
MYLLDSCTISYFMKGEVSVANKIKETSPAVVYTSTITQMEITYGLIRKFNNSHRYFDFFKDFISAITVLAFDENAALEAAEIKKNLEKKGTPIGAYDILIAGVAKSSDLVLVTSNIKEFKKIDDLNIENWRDK